MEKPKKEFWKQVYQESRRRIREELGTRGELVKLLVLIVSFALVCGLGVMLTTSGIFNISPNYVEIASWLFGGNLVVVLVLWISEPVIAVFRIFDIAAEINLRLLAIVEKMESNKAELLITTEINNGDWVGIRITNGEGRMIEGVIKVEAIPEAPTFSDSLELRRHGVLNDVFKLSPSAHNDFDLVVKHKNGGKVGIPYQSARYFFELSPGVYNLEIHVTGVFRDPPYGSMAPKIEHWKVVYNEGATPALQLEKIQERVDTQNDN